MEVFKTFTILGSSWRRCSNKSIHKKEREGKGISRVIEQISRWQLCTRSGEPLAWNGQERKLQERPSQDDKYAPIPDASGHFERRL